MPDLFQQIASALGDHYRIEQEVGRGGMATVYLAEDVRHHRRVAVKVMRPELASSIAPRRFLREVEIAARLSHPHILPLHDSGERDGLLYYVMPYVEGESLRERLQREQQLPVEDALQVLREVGDALAYAHSMGVVHRDVKPENILLHEGHAVVSDFGVARALAAGETTGGTAITETGIAVGTPAYMSPEQASGEVAVDGRADIYALAAVFYEMLAGEPPFPGATPRTILARQLRDEIRSLTPVRSVSPALDGVMRKALAHSPADRYATMTVFVDDVRRAIEGERPLTRPAMRGPRAWLWAALILVATAAGWLGWRAASTDNTPDAATIVVLPFTNVGGNPDNRAFADGLMEVLTSKLTQLEPFFARPLWVIPTSEVRDQRTGSAAAARREFAASLVLTGSVQRQRDTINLTLNLVDAATLRQMRSAVLRGPVDDLALWQDGIVDRVAGMLDLEMRPGARRILDEGSASEAEAYDLYVRGRGYLQGVGSVTNAQKAADLFRDAVDRDPRFALGYAGAAEAYWQMYSETADTSWVGLAVAASQRALALNDSIPAVWVTLGLIHNGTGQYASAIADLEHALRLDPSNSEALSRLGRAYEGVKQPEKAEATYRRAVTIKPYDWRAHKAFGLFYNRQGRYAEAAQQFLRVTELNPLNVRGYINAGGILFYLERWDEARHMFQRAIAIEPDAGAYNNIGTIDFYEGAYEAAAGNFQHAVDLAADNYLYWGNFADAQYWVPGQRERSRETYRHAIELADGARHVNSADTRALSSLARYHAILGDTAVTLNLVRELAPLVVGDGNLMFNIGWSEEVLGHRKAALDWVGRALEAGYSRKIIEASPDLAGLRADPRYHTLREP